MPTQNDWAPCAHARSLAASLGRRATIEPDASCVRVRARDYFPRRAFLAAATTAEATTSVRARSIRGARASVRACSVRSQVYTLEAARSAAAAAAAAAARSPLRVPKTGAHSRLSIARARGADASIFVQRRFVGAAAAIDATAAAYRELTFFVAGCPLMIVARLLTVRSSARSPRPPRSRALLHSRRRQPNLRARRFWRGIERRFVGARCDERRAASARALALTSRCMLQVRVGPKIASDRHLARSPARPLVVIASMATAATTTKLRSPPPPSPSIVDRRRHRRRCRRHRRRCRCRHRSLASYHVAPMGDDVARSRLLHASARVDLRVCDGRRFSHFAIWALTIAATTAMTVTLRLSHRTLFV